MPKRVIKTRSSLEREKTRQTGGRTGWILAIGCATCACDILRIEGRREKEWARDSHRISFFMFLVLPLVSLFLLGFLTQFIVIRLLTFSVTTTTYKRHNVSISIEFFFFSSLLILSLYFVGYYRNEHDDNIWLWPVDLPARLFNLQCWQRIKIENNHLRKHVRKKKRQKKRLPNFWLH
jgi:hypothetical protein